MPQLLFLLPHKESTMIEDTSASGMNDEMFFSLIVFHLGIIKLKKVSQQSGAEQKFDPQNPNAF